MLESQLRDIATGLQALGLLPAQQGAAVSSVTTVASASLIPAASTGNAGRWYWVTGADGGTMYYCDGVSNFKVSPGVGEVDGGIVEYALTAPITSGAAALTASVALPNITITGGKLGNYGKLEIYLAAYLSTNAGTLSARAITIGFGGGTTNVMNEVASPTDPAIGIRRDIKCTGPATQIITEKANAAYGPFGTSAAIQSLTKDQSTDLTIAGNVSWTSSSNIVATVYEYRVIRRAA